MATTSTPSVKPGLHRPHAPGHVTSTIAQVLNTSELLDLILSKLRLANILFRAQLTYRGFRNAIITSSSIEGVLAITKLLTLSLYTNSRTRCWETNTVDRYHSVCRLLYFDFEPRRIERFASSSSFRNLYLSEAEMKRVPWWLNKPGNEYLVIGQFLPTDLDTSVVTAAGLLERVI